MFHWKGRESGSHMKQSLRDIKGGIWELGWSIIESARARKVQTLLYKWGTRDSFLGLLRIPVIRNPLYVINICCEGGGGSL